MNVHRSPLKNESDMRAISAPQRSSPCRFKRPLNCINSAHPDLNTRDIHEFAVKDLQEVARHVPLQAFFQQDGLLPPLPEGVNMRNILAALPGGSTNPLDQGGKWRGFNHESNFVGIKRHTLFANLPKIIERIVDASGLDKSHRTLIFECNPTSATSLSTRGNNSKPDCVGRLATVTTGYSQREWIDVAVPGEFKRFDTRLIDTDTYAKILWSGRHMMREDPRRRFGYGFTIEGWNMRMWYMNRSDIFVSWAMDINKYQKEFIEFFLRLTFADTYQLGWDPTIRRRPRTNPRSPICYDIDLNGKTYRTFRMLSDVGAAALRGRGTRVWEVRELSKDGEEDLRSPVLVLKDSWVDREHTREGEILQKIRNDAYKKSESLARAVELTLMKALTWGDVEHNGKRDETLTEKQRENILRKIDEEVQVEVDYLTRDVSAAGHLPATEARPPPKTKGQTSIRYSPKVHHRIIFTEVGQRLTELTSLSKVFHCLARVLLGLHAIHRCGWVHRDVSIGNILVVNGRTGKITDVEYAKPEDAPARPDDRTGTTYFMSHEAEYRTYFHCYMPSSASKSPQSVDNVQDSEDDDETLWNDILDHQRLIDAPPAAKDASYDNDTRKSILEDPHVTKEAPPFRYNPLHDIESVFWVALWVLLCSTYIKDDESIPQEKWDAYMKVHEDFASELFCDPRIRQGVMSRGDPEFKNGFNKVLPRLRSIGSNLDRFRIRLIQAYEDAERGLKEKNYTIPFDVAKPIYKELTAIFDDISAQLRGNDLTIVLNSSNVSASVDKEATKPGAVAVAHKSQTPDKEKLVTCTDHGETARPTKSQKTALTRSAGKGTAPALSPYTMPRGAKTDKSSKRNGKPAPKRGGGSKPKRGGRPRGSKRRQGSPEDIFS